MTPTKQDEPVEVIVRPNNRYGEAVAGTRLIVPRREFESHTRCLEEAKPAKEGPPPSRTRIVSVRADVAQMLGFPLGRRQEGPLTFEVTRLRPDGKEPLPLREDLERAAHGRGSLRVQVDAGPVREAIESLASAFGWEEEDGEALAWLKESLPKIKGHYDEAQKRAEKHVRERAEVMEREHGAEIERLRERAAAELAAVRQELASAQAELATARAAQEKPAKEQSTPPKGKGKEG